jgi:hypothetical protein
MIVPMTKRSPPAPPQPDPTFLAMAAASMHKEGKLSLNPETPNDQPAIPRKA